MGTICLLYYAFLFFQIKVAHLAGKLGKKAETLIYNALSMDEPDIKLVYVTPEKLMKNNELNDLLVSLNEKDLLTRYLNVKYL